MKKILLIPILILAAIVGNAQSPDLPFVKNEMLKINNVFDSSRYLGFRVNVTYSTDTLFGQFEHEEMDLEYILNNRNFYYKTGSMEYIQNDSFVFNVYNDDKMLVMTKDNFTTQSNLFPLRTFLDSVISLYDSAYTITVSNDEEVKIIDFQSIDSNVLYDRFAIYYDSLSYYPEKFDMWFKGGFDMTDIPDSLMSAVAAMPLRKKVSMRFTEFFNISSLDIFSNVNYIYFDRMRKLYKPSEKYTGYRFVTNGVPGEDSDQVSEIAPPPEE